uniref:Ovule protein n=1 Tax=Brugia timori TaxID=42155 RepID=A0A0R3Q8G1_9BILA
LLEEARQCVSMTWSDCHTNHQKFKYTKEEMKVVVIRFFGTFNSKLEFCFQLPFYLEIRYVICVFGIKFSVSCISIQTFNIDFLLYHTCLEVLFKVCLLCMVNRFLSF